MMGSITIRNDTDSAIQITSKQDNFVIEKDRTKTYTIPPKDYFIIFTERVESLHWDKKTGQ